MQRGPALVAVPPDTIARSRGSSREVSSGAAAAEPASHHRAASAWSWIAPAACLPSRASPLVGRRWRREQPRSAAAQAARKTYKLGNVSGKGISPKFSPLVLLNLGAVKCYRI